MAQFGRRELELMQILWLHGPQTAREVRERVKDDIADPTVRTILRILEEKKAVAHTKRGRAFIYRARAGMKQTLRKMLKDIVNGFFGGAPEALVAHMLVDKQISSDALTKARKMAKKAK